ncbi:hypothetical protein BXZ70DRAFT_911070 [Cristinia sonorae]|uniref:Uncharacterized protein n=1 Tax=Cristinia sonorae TaxID=1940300 RepID=A0A8K0XKD2_9AGAR|nr:hypothetical protein BXZ70DRAFT_911070 [Cristinia sonorae]
MVDAVGRWWDGVRRRCVSITLSGLTAATPMVATSDNATTRGENPPTEDPSTDPTLELYLPVLTVYRLMNIIVLVAFGTAKFVLAMHGYSASPTALEWAIGVLFTAVSYFAGLYESEERPIWPWFFRKNYTGHIVIFTVRFLRTSFAISLRGIVIPSISLVVVFLPVRLMLYASATMKHGQAWWLPIALWITVWLFPAELPCIAIANSVGRLIPGRWASTTLKLWQRVNSMTDGVSPFNVTDLLAGTTVIVICTIGRTVYDGPWWNTFPALENSVVLLAMEIARRRLHPKTEEVYGYVLVWVTALVYSLFKLIAE